MISRLTEPLHHLLSTLHDSRYRLPRKTRFRLAGCAFAGRESNPLGHGERFQSVHVILLSRACPVASWAHQRRSFIDRAAGHVGLRRWCQRWIERIALLYQLNDARLDHYDPARPVERQSPVFDAAHAELKEAVDALFAAAEAQLAGLTHRARRAKPLRSLLNHREGLCVFVDRPFVPMDNNRGELSLRGAVIGRRLSFGSDSEQGAGFTAMMYSVAGTLAIAGIDVRHWLREWLSACAGNGGKPPDDLSPWLPWSMGGERRRELAAPG